MRQLTPEEKEQLDVIKGMIVKNERLITEYNLLSEDQKAEKPYYIDGLVRRTDMLKKVVNDIEALTEQ